MKVTVQTQPFIKVVNTTEKRTLEIEETPFNYVTVVQNHADDVEVSNDQTLKIVVQD